jgi:hypothetical protein
MSSVSGKNYKQTSAYFVPVGDCRQSIQQYTPGTGATVGSFSQATWTIINQTGYNTEYMSSIATAGAGGVFRDMGKTVVSSGLTFRKVQLLVNSPATNGISGPAGTVPDADYLTGYFQLSSGTAGVSSGAAPIAMYPSLW